MERSTSIEELRKSLECPVCWEIPEAGPLYQCENGHTLCSGCNGKVKKLCPVCRVKLPKDRIRNLYAEKKLHTFKRYTYFKSYYTIVLYLIIYNKKYVNFTKSLY